MLTIPPPTLKYLSNFTPFRHFRCQKMGKGRVFFDCVVLKGSFQLRAGVLPLSAQPAPIQLSDSYADGHDASRSSVLRAGDLHAPKPGTDVIVTGTARPPGGRPARRWSCEVLVHHGNTPLLGHRLDATGPRRWKRGAFGWSLSEPEATGEVPVRYELAYGGHFARRVSEGAPPSYEVYRPNPSGTGFFDPDRMDAVEGRPGPQWELATAPVVAPNRESPLAGFGPVARMWASRLRFGGTYDAAWRDKRRADAAQNLVADYPDDFDPRFFQCAHPALQSATHFTGDEQYSLRSLLPDLPDLAFRLPSVQPVAELLPAVGSWTARSIPLDTVHVDLDARRVDVVWRLALDPRERVCAALISLPHGGKRPTC
jgi:hypothetical protein